MYREKIREYYDHLSRSYRRVADYIMSKYYEVSFMTAAQLAYAVGVDTTTVVRFSQRLGYNGYPELLHDIREQVKSEIYAAYEPKPTIRRGRSKTGSSTSSTTSGRCWYTTRLNWSRPSRRCLTGRVTSFCWAKAMQRPWRK